MAKNKRTKPLKTPTTKGKRLPESIQWLLGYANIGSKLGKLAPLKIAGTPTVKRPPVEQASPKNEPPIDLDFLNHMISKDFIDPVSARNILQTQIKDENDNLWIKPGKEWFFIGKTRDAFPPLKEFRAFLSKSGVIEDKCKPSLNSSLFEMCQLAVCHSLISKMKTDIGLTNYKRFAEAFVYVLYKVKLFTLPKPDTETPGSIINGLKYPHDGTLSQIVCAYILDFWHNQRELHQDLRQCKCCGRFEIVQVTKGSKGRKKIYCSDDCKEVFNRKSRKADKALKASSRKEIKKVRMPVAKKEIIELLLTLDYTKEEAEKVFEEVRKSHPTNVSSKKSFQNTWLKGYY